MREILFRGKRTDNSEWVEGSLFVGKKYYICPFASDTQFSYGDQGHRIRIGCWYEVYPETVGQITGLLDKNGKKIFEGDIVIIKDYSHGVALNYKQPTSKWIVKWYEKTANFSIDYMNILPFDFKRSEVIGNIYDNPELLEG